MSVRSHSATREDVEGRVGRLFFEDEDLIVVVVSTDLIVVTSFKHFHLRRKPLRVLRRRRERWQLARQEMQRQYYIRELCITRSVPFGVESEFEKS